MRAEVTEQRVRKMLAEGKSQREMAQALKIPRTSLQRIIKNLDTPALPASGAPSRAKTASPVTIPLASTPVVDAGTLSPAEFEAVRADFWDMIAWWRDRKMKLVQKNVPRDMVRSTYHVERRFVELIRHEAESEGVSITEVVNRALRMYFERR
jgi:hypothetical protein